MNFELLSDTCPRSKHLSSYICLWLERVCQRGSLENRNLSEETNKTLDVLIFLYFTSSSSVIDFGYAVKGLSDFRELENNVCSDFSFSFFQKEQRHMYELL